MKTYFNTKTCTWKLLAASFIIAKKWKQSKCLSTDQMDKQSVVYPHNGILFKHKNDGSVVITTWINFENIMLSEKSQTQKTTYYMVLFIWNIQNS